MLLWADSSSSRDRHQIVGNTVEVAVEGHVIADVDARSRSLTQVETIGR
jgi:hypothetical protein